MSPTSHAELAPSAASRWMNCAGSVALSRGQPDDSSAPAREGTFAHELAHRCLVNLENASARVGDVGSVNEDGEIDYSETGEFECDDDMAGHIQDYLDAVRDVVPARGTSALYELKVGLDGLRDDIWGRLDAMVLAAAQTLHVFDLKFGAGVWVDVEENQQLMTYALAALLSHPDELYRVRNVVLHVVQPRHHRGGHTWWSITAKALRNWGLEELQPAAKRTEDPAAPLEPGDWCRFCPGKPICPALKALTMERTRELFSDEEFSAPMKVPPPPESLATEDLAKALRAFPLIEQWIKAVREHAYTQAAGGKVPDGFKLVEKFGYRKWTSEEDALAALEMFLPEGKSPWAKPKLLSPNQAEKMLSKGDKKMVSKLITKPSSGTVLVPDSDKRLAYDPASVFAEDSDSSKTTKAGKAKKEKK